MPNWCENQLTIRGAKKDLEDFKQKIKPQEEKEICLFSTFRPMPIEYKGVRSPNTDKDLSQNLIQKYGHSDWYSWANSVWGTKWGCCDAYWEIEEPEKCEYNNNGNDDLYSIKLHYNTAWSPGEECLKEIFEELDNLSFFLKYYEPGMGFEGSLFVRNGVTEYEQCRDIVVDDIESVW